MRYQVKFPDVTSWVPSDQIEGLPDRESPVDLLEAGKLGRAIDLRRTLIHARLTGRLADVVYSMESTNTDYYPYQFKPVLRFLFSPSNALLIADEVGLGKTIEAGLIWTELRSRFDLRRLLVLCPAFLREKWQRELAHKIGVRSQIVDAAGLLRTLQDPDAAIRGFAVICSLQGARPNRDWSQTESPNSAAELARFLRSREHDEPLVDLLVVDEAHYLRNPETQTNELGRLFRPVAENLLLLSATPIHNYNQDLFTLLQLLDADTFERPEDLEQILNASRPLVEARDHILSRSPSRTKLIEILDRAAAHPLLRGNRQLEVTRRQIANLEQLTDHNKKAELARRLETINPLAYVITRTRKREVKEWRVLRQTKSETVPMKPCEKKLYDAVTKCVIDYAMSRAVNERFLLATPQRQMTSSMAATLRAWQKRRENVDDVAAASREDFRVREDEIGPLTLELINRADGFGDFDELKANDSKYARVVAIFRKFFRQHPQEKVVVFSTYRETLNYLGERLSDDQISNVVMHGGISESKEQILRRFQADPSIRVLLSSEVGSEGIDLQFCRVLVNYDLPWNPMRVEQRIGRLDRLGQTAQKILIWNLLYEGTIDARIYSRLYEKLDLCRQALGDFEAVLGDEIRKLTTDLLSDHLTPEQQEARIDQTAQALANLRKQQEELEGEAAHLVAYGDYILEQVRAARELHRWINGRDLLAYVTDFFRLHYPGCIFRQIEGTDCDYDVTLSAAARQDLEQFIKDSRLPTSTSLTRHLSGPVRCRFENRLAGVDDARIEIITQFHPLVRFASRLINDCQEQLNPALSVALSADRIEGVSLVPGLYVLAVARWSVEGLQSVEKLAFAGGRVDHGIELLDTLDAERLAAACAQHGTDWFEARNSVDLMAIARVADEELFGRLEEEFAEFVADVRRQNEDRADLQLRNLNRHLESQRRKFVEIRNRHLTRAALCGDEREKKRFEALAKATEKRIENLENRVEQRRIMIEKRRDVRYRSDELLVALVRVD